MPICWFDACIRAFFDSRLIVGLQKNIFTQVGILHDTAPISMKNQARYVALHGEGMIYIYSTAGVEQCV